MRYRITSRIVARRCLYEDTGEHARLINKIDEETTYLPPNSPVLLFSRNWNSCPTISEAVMSAKTNLFGNEISSPVGPGDIDGYMIWCEYGYNQK